MLWWHTQRHWACHKRMCMIQRDQLLALRKKMHIVFITGEKEHARGRCTREGDEKQKRAHVRECEKA